MTIDKQSHGKTESEIRLGIYCDDDRRCVLFFFCLFHRHRTKSHSKSDQDNTTDNRSKFRPQSRYDAFSCANVGALANECRFSPNSDLIPAIKAKKIPIISEQPERRYSATFSQGTIKNKPTISSSFVVYLNCRCWRSYCQK